MAQDAELAEAARAAFMRYGRGHHPAVEEAPWVNQGLGPARWYRSWPSRPLRSFQCTTRSRPCGSSNLVPSFRLKDQGAGSLHP